MARLTVELIGIKELQKKALALASPETFAKAQRGGVAYAAKSVPPAVAKGITAAYNIRSARVKDDISAITFVDNNEAAIIRFSRRPPTLSQFRPNPGVRGYQRGLGRGMGWAKANPKGKPLSAMVIRAEGRKPRYGAFIATGLQGNNLVLQRQGSGPDSQLVGLYGPSVGSIFTGNSSIGPELRATVQQRIQEQYIKGFERALSAAARGF